MTRITSHLTHFLKCQWKCRINSNSTVIIQQLCPWSELLIFLWNDVEKMNPSYHFHENFRFPFDQQVLLRWKPRVNFQKAISVNSEKESDKRKCNQFSCFQFVQDLKSCFVKLLHLFQYEYWTTSTKNNTL